MAKKEIELEVDVRGLEEALGEGPVDMPVDAAPEAVSSEAAGDDDVFLYSVEDLAEASGLKVSTVKQYIRTKKLDVTRFSDVVKFILARQTKSYEHEVDGQKRAEMACGMGVIALGKRKDDGAFLFKLPIAREGDWVASFDAAKAKLEKAGYLYGDWPTSEGILATGWAQA